MAQRPIYIFHSQNEILNDAAVLRDTPFLLVVVVKLMLLIFLSSMALTKLPKPVNVPTCIPTQSYTVCMFDRVINYFLQEL